MADSGKLKQLSPDTVKRNPDNPRMIFREKELNELLSSIESVGIQVPITVYSSVNSFVLIDGERRWRCSKKLNIKSMPAIVLPKPSRLNNLLMMFNIHNVRLDWDTMPMAYKLKDVEDMLKKRGKPYGAANLSAITGVPSATVKRALELLGLPKKYQNMLMEEAKKPKDQRELKPDLFIEIIKSRNTIRRYTPGVFDSFTPKEYMDSMVKKYQAGTINNVVKFRDVSKIARGEKAGIRKEVVKPFLKKLVTDPEFKIEDAYQQTVAKNYDMRDLNNKAESFLRVLKAIKGTGELSSTLKKNLKLISARIEKLIE